MTGVGQDGELVQVSSPGAQLRQDGLEFVDHKNRLLQRGPEQVLLLAQAGLAHLLPELLCLCRSDPEGDHLVSGSDCHVSSPPHKNLVCRRSRSGNDNIPKIFVDSHTKQAELSESYQLARQGGKSGCGLLPAKGVWQSLAASQTLCLSHLWVGKIALRPVATNGPRWHSALRGDAVILCFPLFRSPPAELSPAPQIRFKTAGREGTLSLPQSRHTAVHRRSTGGPQAVTEGLITHWNNSSFSRKKQSPRWLCSLHRIRCLLCISSPAE